MLGDQGRQGVYPVQKAGEPESLHLRGGGDKEVLLLQSELLALVRPVIRVQHAAQGFCSLPRQHSLQH